MRRRQFLLSTLALAAASRASAQALRPFGGIVTPPLDLADIEGTKHRLSDYRGKVVLVNFWATWCAPCREEMPSIEKLRAAMADRPFAIVAISVGDSSSAVRRFKSEVPVGFPLLLDQDTKTSREWGARVLPASFLVSPTGVARYQYYGALDWAAADVRGVIEKMMR